MASSDVLRAVLRATPEALVVVDESGAIVFVNDRAVDLLGWPADDLVGTSVERLVPQRTRADHPELRARFHTRPTARPMGVAPDTAARRRDGSEFPADISLIPIEHDAGSRLVLVTVRPVGEDAEREARLRQHAAVVQREQLGRLEALAQLAGGVAHDFNNVFGVILNFASLLAESTSDPGILADLEQIQSAAERGATLTQQLVSFARRDASHPEPIDVGALVRAFAPEVRQCLGESIDLVLDLEDGPLIASADRQQLEQSILFVATNAREAMPIGGVVRLHAGVEPSAQVSDSRSWIAIEVTDTGTGMAPDIAARAFEPFFTTKPEPDGKGLGLATVHGIARRHGGRALIRSTVGAGTTVRIELPVPAERVEPAPDPLEAPGGRTILLVEDEPALRDGTARLLRGAGYDVLVAGDGVEALEVFEREGESVDLLLSDVVMPRMRGDELARRLVDLDPTLRVIMISGHDFGGAPLLGRLLQKPVQKDELLRNIREALDG